MPERPAGTPLVRSRPCSGTRDVSSSGSQRSASSTKAPAPTAVEPSVRAAPIRSAGRWAVPSGIDTTKVLPCPKVLSARDRAAVELDQLLDQGQADAGPLVRPAARPLDPVEPLEEAGQLLGRDARPGVADGQLRRAADRAAGGRRSRPRR